MRGRRFRFGPRQPHGKLRTTAAFRLGRRSNGAPAPASRCLSVTCPPRPRDPGRRGAGAGPPSECLCRAARGAVSEPGPRRRRGIETETVAPLPRTAVSDQLPRWVEQAQQETLLDAHPLTARAEIQRDLVIAYPNISALDLTVLLRAIDSVLGKVALAIRFMALFSIASGLVILVGAIGTSRFQRIRESILLKTIGARSRTIRRILATEYFALGTLAGFTGVLLAAIAGWLLIRFLFELNFYLPGVPLVTFWLATAVLTTAIGLANSRDVVRRTPLAGMRDLAE